MFDKKEFVATYHCWVRPILPLHTHLQSEAELRRVGDAALKYFRELDENLATFQVGTDVLVDGINRRYTVAFPNETVLHLMSRHYQRFGRSAEAVLSAMRLQVGNRYEPLQH